MFGKSSGVFSLYDSNNHVGSYITIEDCAEIPETTATDLSFIVKIQIDNIAVISH